MTRVALHGASGRMGQAIARVLHERSSRDGGAPVLAQAFTGPSDPAIGTDVGAHAQIGSLGVALEALERIEADVVIDFSAPDATRAIAQREDVSALVSGTTGLTDDDFAALDALAERAPVLWAPNMSVGVNVLFHLAEEAARILGDRYDAEIVEMHHRHKVDAPSGTAKRLAERVAKGKSLGSEAFVYGREGQVGPRGTEIGVMTLRGGGVVGEHSLYLTDDGERLELTHRALDRAIFARGAVDAAAWIVSQPPGRYGMADMLGLTSG